MAEKKKNAAAVALGRLGGLKGIFVTETGLGGAWYFQDHVKSDDPRFRKLVKYFAEAGYSVAEEDEFTCATG